LKAGQSSRVQARKASSETPLHCDDLGCKRKLITAMVSEVGRKSLRLERKNPEI